jgi:hypothetical protein
VVEVVSGAAVEDVGFVDVVDSADPAGNEQADKTRSKPRIVTRIDRRSLIVGSEPDMLGRVVQL